MASAALGTTLRQIHRLLSEGSLAGLSDEQLLTRYVAERDEAAFEAVVARHGPMVVGVCRSILRDEHAAEDAFQATFLVLARKANAISDRDSLGGWLHRVAYRIAVAAGVERQRRRQAEASASVLSDRSEGRGDWHSVLHEEIDRLPEVLRAPIVLCYLQELTYEQAAQQLSWTVPTLRSRLAKARGKLRSRLIRRGLIGAVGLLGGLADARWAIAAIPAHWIRRVVSNAAGAPAVSGTAVTLASAMLRTMAFSRTKGFAIVAVSAAVTMASFGLLAASFQGNGKGLAQEPVNKVLPRVIPPPVSPPVRPTRDMPGATVEVRGQVVDPAGKPVAGASLRIDQYVTGLAKPAEGGEPTAKSGTDGRFTLTVPRDVIDMLSQGLARRASRVVASASGFGLGWAEAGSRSDNVHDVTIRMVEDDVPLEGRVLDLEGRPIAGALVRTSDVFDPPGRDLSPWIETFKNGVNGPYDGLDSMPLQLTRTTGPDGRFRLDGVGRERVVMFTIFGPTIELTRGFAMTKETPPIRAANPRIIAPKTVVYHGCRFDYIAAPGRVVTGVVRDQDTAAPLVGVEIHGMSFDSSNLAYYKEVNAISDEQGRYRLVGLGQADHYRLFATPGQGQPYPTAEFIEKSTAFGSQSAIIDLRLKRGILVRGRVTDKATGKPLVASVVSFALRDNPHVKDFPAFGKAYEPRAYTDAEGRFEIAALPGPGILAARGYSDGYLSGVGAEAIPGMNSGLSVSALPHDVSPSHYHVFASLDFEPGAEPVTCDMQCDPGRSLSGTIVDPEGKPITGVWAHGLKPVQIINHPALETDQFQAIALDSKHPRRLYFFHEGRGLSGSVVVKGTESGPLVVQLQPQGVITGRIVDDDGEPKTRLELRSFNKPELNLLRGDILKGGRVDSEGRFRLVVVPGLAYGASAITEQSPGVRVRLFEAENLGPGEIRDLGDLRFKQPPGQ
ncbi:sigma-70 family RNA polymerase sigma factor [Singulisphaera acidiphila]|uniref:RNA polymerase sigma factor, sigma-70 family n=1 Tax=Singulisphaera acidiphila (strain ATCC BAA-1392 / DSM 18658 / VKM B-2454 / MOB10) TaxID=886293 RepID=L0DQE6_SINAD|nr:sigma-70 family RNA polymerase sigma factor [Singulisphaera acidiphila]AGA31133.1 RNA polymerase sigma factor, sigma-70 family [Singulisphaera acidiphila DSM 18658]